MAPLDEHHSVHRKVPGSIPGQIPDLVLNPKAGYVPRPGSQPGTFWCMDDAQPTEPHRPGQG